MTWPKFWTKTSWQTRLLSPLATLTCRVAQHRFQQFQQHPNDFSPRPTVIVVGNIVVGGSGKTPFIQWLGRQLQQHEIPFGVISRGYGGKAKQYPLEVLEETPAVESGDEPLMLKQSLNCPVVVSPKRREALEKLMACYPEVQVVISDDGLQHFALPRDFEVVLMDSQRWIGNGQCLPAGPLREPVSRLQSVDAVVCNQNSRLTQNVCQDWEFGQNLSAEKTFALSLQPVCFRSIQSPHEVKSVEAFAGESAVAMAGIGNPHRFFETLAELKIHVNPVPLKDHQPLDLAFLQQIRPHSDKPLIMTQKDAVKCESFRMHLPNAWFLEVQPLVSDALWQTIHSALKERDDGS